ncbi:hypothetical protein [Nocardioides sp. T2.26MG-1]|uniref:hypothetical protein n=1 Tax=Nocardioides sp. T2.26MG-1 TaxID=3041166 RepID=UPI00247742AF|nr:hypothetical protein [Nocardioides sp. T2.26MG-1]CAI9417347.1 hypothetical protein HIDPHFAB_02997 [Nocardioides sp. T2.26MG-1]
MAENQSTKGQFLLKEKDFVKVVDADGNDLPAVPKHWGEDQLPAGASKKGRASSSSSSSSSTPTPPPDPDAEPAGNASRDAWADWAKRVKGATDADLVDTDGKDLGRDEIKAKFGTPGS